MEKSPKLIKSIEQLHHIEFSHIKTLDVENNFLQSIEALCRIQLKTLETIYMCTLESIVGDNCVYATSPLIKAQWPSLNKLSFCTYFVK